jgi:hypothetical protein
VDHHYSRSFPSGGLCIGLFRKVGLVPSQLVGVAVFSHPSNEATLPAYLPGISGTPGVELGRFVLLQSEPRNTESWFIARAFELRRQTLCGVMAVISFSDPMPRSKLNGTEFMPGHVGTIYQATNGLYLGRSSARTIMAACSTTARSPSSSATSAARTGSPHNSSTWAADRGVWVRARRAGLGASRPQASCAAPATPATTLTPGRLIGAHMLCLKPTAPTPRNAMRPRCLPDQQRHLRTLDSDARRVRIAHKPPSRLIPLALLHSHFALTRIPRLTPSLV